ncbi:hypothetical protein [Janthinobacterium sp. TND4EL3]|uniref:hypothetical protein n=1 Tax=Janthinobacterium sp. TND4EL3 TaxID=1907311 RepID=UPI000970F462|nr:hypothetical protein [Janthinobacterium sp. TND4EL3]
MTHPLKKVSVTDLQTALAETLQKLTGSQCEVNIEDIDFKWTSAAPFTTPAGISMTIQFTKDYGQTGKIDPDTPF